MILPLNNYLTRCLFEPFSVPTAQRLPNSTMGNSRRSGIPARGRRPSSSPPYRPPALLCAAAFCAKIGQGKRSQECLPQRPGGGLRGAYSIPLLASPGPTGQPRHPRVRAVRRSPQTTTVCQNSTAPSFCSPCAQSGHKPPSLQPAQVANVTKRPTTSGSSAFPHLSRVGSSARCDPH